MLNSLEALVVPLQVVQSQCAVLNPSKLRLPYPRPTLLALVPCGGGGVLCEARGTRIDGLGSRPALTGAAIA